MSTTVAISIAVATVAIMLPLAGWFIYGLKQKKELESKLKQLDKDAATTQSNNNSWAKRD